MNVNSLPISVTLLTRNSELFLAQVLQALHKFPEIILYDNGSQDCTLEIAKQFSNVKIYQGDFIGFGPTHNYVSNLATYDWILSVDSDEILTEQLVQEISSLQLQDNTVYSIPRRNEYRGRWIRGCSWYPDRQIRLYNRKCTQFSNAQVHESILTKAQTLISLQNPLLHISYKNISDFLCKMQTYSELFANQYQGKRSSSPCKAVLHSIWTFFKSYVLKRGFLDGYEGFLISSYNAHTAFYKYLKLYELNQKIEKQ